MTDSFGELNLQSSLVSSVEFASGTRCLKCERRLFTPRQTSSWLDSFELESCFRRKVKKVGVTTTLNCSSVWSFGSKINAILKACKRWDIGVSGLSIGTKDKNSLTQLRNT